jgi:hypothetical protein
VLVQASIAWQRLTNSDNESNCPGKGTDKESRFLENETTRSQVSVRVGDGDWVERGKEKCDATYLWMTATSSA